MGEPFDFPIVLPDQIPEGGDRHALRAYYGEVLGRWVRSRERAGRVAVVELDVVRAALADLLAALESAGLARRGASPWARLADEHVVRDGARLFFDFEGLAEALASLWLGTSG